MKNYKKLSELNNTFWFNLFALNGLLFGTPIFRMLYNTPVDSGTGIKYFTIVIGFILFELFVLVVWLYEPHIEHKIKNEYFTNNIAIKILRYIGALANVGLIMHLLYIFVYFVR